MNLQYTDPFENIYFFQKSLQIPSGLCGRSLTTKLEILLKFIFGKSNVDYLVNVTSRREKEWQIWYECAKPFQSVLRDYSGTHSQWEGFSSHLRNWLAERTSKETYRTTRQLLRGKKRKLPYRTQPLKYLSTFHSFFALLAWFKCTARSVLSVCSSMWNATKRLFGRLKDGQSSFGCSNKDLGTPRLGFRFNLEVTRI